MEAIEYFTAKDAENAEGDMEETQEEVRGGIGKSPKIEEAKPSGGVDFKGSRFLFILLILGVISAVMAGSRRLPNNSQGMVTPSASWTFMDYFPWGLCALLMFIIYIFFRRIGFVGENGIQKNNDAINLINSGELIEAAAIFDDILQKNPKKSLIRALVMMNRGYVSLLQGDLVEARAQLQEAQTMAGDTSIDPELPALITSNMAMCEGLMGNCDAVEKQLQLSKKTLRPQRSGILVRARAVLAMRRNNFAEAELILCEGWRKSEGTGHAAEFKALRVLRAFALSKLDRTAEQTDAMAKLLAGLYPYRQGEFDYLGVKWPEMKAFLEEQKLSAAG